MSRRSGFAILFAGALVGATAFALVVRSLPENRPIGLGLQSYAKGVAIVTLTNLDRSKLDYILKVERKIGDSWPNYPQGIPVGTDSGQDGSLQPGEVSAVTVPVMVYAPPYPWRVSVFCCWNAPGENTTRFKAGLWLLRLHKPKLAVKAFGEFKVVQVSGPQMDQ